MFDLVDGVEKCGICTVVIYHLSDTSVEIHNLSLPWESIVVNTECVEEDTAAWIVAYCYGFASPKDMGLTDYSE